jgi:glycosyltransferase involved in cell wall biosynthesis
MSAPLRVAVDARLFSGRSGGVETVLLGLADGLSALNDSSLDLSFVGYRGHTRWLEPHLDEFLHLHTINPPFILSTKLQRALGPLRDPLRRLRNSVTRSNTVRPDDEAIQQTDPDVVHFAHQEAGLVSVPFIYQPHDLQHLHMPEFFTRDERKRRANFYGPLCHAAARVVVGTSWVRDDVIERLNVEPAKVLVIPLAPVTTQSAPATRPAALPPAYLLYPAATWLHKNHLRLLEAFRLVVDEYPDAHLVLTGATIAVDVASAARKLDLQANVTHLGFLSESDLAATYHYARGVVVPTLFESASFPIWEAFQRGVPVACSSVTALPRQVGDAAVIFDPYDVTSIAGAVTALWSDADLRTSLIAKGHVRVAQFSWLDTARRFAAVYRDVAGRASADDLALLAEEPLI